MKKTIAFLLGALLALSLALTACGDKSPAETSPTPDSTPTVEEPAQSPEETADTEGSPDAEVPDETDAAGDAGSIIRTVIEQTKPSIDAMNESLAGTMTVDISARGNAFVYTFTYGMDVAALGGKDLMASSLEAGMAAQEATYTALRDMLVGLGVADASVIIEYMDNAGELIYSVEYK
jgi:predicted small lipoprotein YifL